MTEDAPVTELLRRATVSTTRAEDTRVLAAMARAEHGSRSSRRRAAWWAAAIVVLGIAVTAAAIWPADDEQRRNAVLPDGGPDPQDAQEPAPPQRVSAAETLAAASHVLVLEVHLPDGPLPGDGIAATVLRVVQGDGVEAGRNVQLLWNQEGKRSNVEAALDRADLEELPRGKVVCLMALAAIGDNPVPTRFRSPFGRGLRATLVAREGRLGDRSGMAALRRELLAATWDPSATVRSSAVAALARWDPEPTWDGHRQVEPQGDDLLWGDATTRRLLLDLVGDPAPGVREQVAQIIPPAAEGPLHDALVRLAFDRYSAIRATAVRRLQAVAVDPWLEEASRLSDSWWGTFTLPTSARFWRLRVRESAREEGIEDHLGAFARHVDRDRADNRLLGALELGYETEAVDKALKLLRGLAEDSDPRVRIAAAGSRLRLGDATAWPLLRRELGSKEIKTAVLALETVAGVDHPDVTKALLEASRDERALVRAFAVAALGWTRAAPTDPAARRRIRELSGDPAEVLRAVFNSRR